MCASRAQRLPNGVFAAGRKSGQVVEDDVSCLVLVPLPNRICSTLFWQPRGGDITRKQRGGTRIECGLNSTTNSLTSGKKKSSNYEHSKVRRNITLPPPVPASFHQYRKRVGSAYELRELTRRARAPIARGAGRGASPLQTLRHAPHVRAALQPEVVHVLGRQLVRGALGPGELRAGIAGRTRPQVPSQLLARGGEGTHT